MPTYVKGDQPKDQTKPMQGQIEAEFQDFLLTQNIEFTGAGFIADDQYHHARFIGDKSRKQNAWYVFFWNDGRAYGMCGDYRVDQSKPTATWKAGKGETKFTKADRERIKHLNELAAQRQELVYEETAKKAKELWESFAPCDSHPYLSAKGVGSYGLRVTQSERLAIPVLGSKNQIVGLQYISSSQDEDGRWVKKFLTGTRKKGSFFAIGVEDIRTAPVINYSEGYATAASYYEQHKEPTFITWDAGNIKEVVKVIGGYFPQAQHVIVADNDESGVGQEKAEAAHKELQLMGVEAKVIMPVETGDYNDAVKEGELITQTKEITVPTAFDFNRTDNGRYLNTKDNVKGVLIVNDISVVYNVIKKRMEISVPNTEFIADLKEEAALIEIEDRCIQIGVPHQKVRDYLKLLAKEYNPVKEWIGSRAWDGKPRLQAFLDSVTSSNTQLKELLMTKWLISCVAAACEPEGVALEGILVIQGAQGLGKTLWFKRLANYEDGWLLEGATLNPSDKDSVKQAVSHWIVELGEIESTFKKSDIDQLKAFVTKRTDELRLPYDRAFTTYQRRTAFYASVNAREFLTDTSGNRRFWVIPVTAINADHGIDMQQLWAEVSEKYYQPGQKNWFLTSEERALLQDSNEFYRTQSSTEDLILECVNFESRQTKPTQMTSFLKDLGIVAPRMADFKEAARILSENGIEPRRSNGKKIYDLDYTPPESSVPQPGAGSYFAD